MRKLIVTIVCSHFFILTSSAQNMELVVDTLYSKYLNNNETYLFHNNKEGVVFREGVLDSYPIIGSIYNDYERDKIFVWSNDYLYPVDNGAFSKQIMVNMVS